MPADPQAYRPWSEILRRAGRTTLRAAPWLWVAAMMPVVIDGAWRLKTIGRVTLVAAAVVPLIFLVAVAVQRLPRSWYKPR
jgi:hypothetical protein